MGNDLLRWSPGPLCQGSQPQECFLDKISTKGNKSEHLSIMGSSGYNPTWGGEEGGGEGRGEGRRGRGGEGEGEEGRRKGGSGGGGRGAASRVNQAPDRGPGQAIEEGKAVSWNALHLLSPRVGTL